MTAPANRAIFYRAFGRRQGPLTRLLDLGPVAEALKPFILLHLFAADGPRAQFGLHPHSGIGTLTYVIEGRGNYTDPGGESGVLEPGSLEWMMAGSGMWHAGGSEGGPFLGLQLWLALPPDLELAPWQSRHVPADAIERDGPARVLLGRSGTATSTVAPDLPVTVLAVELDAGASWTYTPPADQTVLWLAVVHGGSRVPDAIAAGEFVAFDAGNGTLTIEATADSLVLLGSARPHDHALVAGAYSVHCSVEALATGERTIAAAGEQLRAAGKI